MTWIKKIIEKFASKLCRKINIIKSKSKFFGVEVAPIEKMVPSCNVKASERVKKKAKLQSMEKLLIEVMELNSSINLRCLFN